MMIITPHVGKHPVATPDFKGTEKLMRREMHASSDRKKKKNEKLRDPCAEVIRG